MPTYQYECGDCGHGFEVLQSMMDKKLKKCPECGKPKLHRLIGTGSGIIFKGTGFYETDYKRKGAPSSRREPTGRRPEVPPVGSLSACGEEPAGKSEGPSSPQEPAGKPAASAKGGSGCRGGCACGH